jgi:hypothetical protein
MKTRTFILALGTAALAAGSASAADITVTGDITTSQTWTKNNVYKLSGQVYVMPGATLTIEPGTVIASIAGGSLAVTRDARIVADGTKDEPIIFTSETDKATWTASNPQGVWRASALEWGNLTIMGNGYIGKYGNGAPTGNVATPNAANYANMEGLVASGATDTRTRYGGGNDQDDSGTLRYASFRYGGKVVGLGTELNGLSLGGVGQATEIDHVEIMNNVDDGIEIWGGKVDLKYFSIWNIGDDSFDLDHGWRGRAQFGLIVQGYSLNAASGSGVCDSIIEIDGAAKSDAQPVTTVNLYNMTLIGQPLSGKRALKYRDNARMQLNNSIIMNAGEAVVRNDNTDGEATDGQTGYGHNGTHTFAETWTTDYNVYPTVNAGIFGGAAAAGAYSAQVAGKLNQITDTVFYGNTNAAAYTEANARGVFAAANNNVQEPADLPIVSITRGAPQSLTGGVIAPVLSLDPRAAGAAVTSVTQAPNNGFFTPVTYRGAFSPTENWMCGWTAAHAYGYSVVPPGGCATAPACPADLTGDGSVDGQDLGVLLGNWGSNGAGNLNGDASVDGQDLGILLGAWGTCD